MNWLAHVFLSEPNVEFQLGNLLADVVRGPQRDTMSAEFVRGAACHKAIDAFTDAHPVVRRSRAHISSEHRRFSAVIVDVFYDYCLAHNWERYAPITLEEYTSTFYANVQARPIELPPDAQTMLDRIIRHDLLGSYARPEGVEHALRRISGYLNARWSKQLALHHSVHDLLAHEAALTADFQEFFPALRSHVSSWYITNAST